MLEKLYGSTEEEQLNYLKPRACVFRLNGAASPL